MTKVFVSHSSVDTWIAKQIALHISKCGASTFLDEANIEHGDDFEANIIKAAKECDELLVLLTPWATTRPYIWLEIGAFWGARKRIVCVLQGITPKDLSIDEKMPVLLKKVDLLQINEIESYFSQLKKRANRRNK
ncbi:MAG: toll/interleukin-1 receptor domain-containing protein [Anaerolineales bacterium]